jgi:hypothetical protein
MTVIAQESSRRVRRHPMRAPVRSDLGFSASMASARAAALALCMALAAAAVTIASLPRSDGKAAAANGGLPIAVTIDRRLKGDRLDRIDPQHSSMPDAPVSPGNIVPKADPATTGPATTSPAVPADPAYAPQDELIEHGCAPGAELETMQCVARADRANSPRHAHAQRGSVLALGQAQMRKQPAGGAGCFAGGEPAMLPARGGLLAQTAGTMVAVTRNLAPRHVDRE